MGVPTNCCDAVVRRSSSVGYTRSWNATVGSPRCGPQRGSRRPGCRPSWRRPGRCGPRRRRARRRTRPSSRAPRRSHRRGGVAVLRREAVVDRHHHAVRLAREPDAADLLGVEIAGDEPAAVDVDDRGAWCGLAVREIRVLAPGRRRGVRDQPLGDGQAVTTRRGRTVGRVGPCTLETRPDQRARTRGVGRRPQRAPGPRRATYRLLRQYRNCVSIRYDVPILYGGDP